MASDGVVVVPQTNGEVTSLVQGEIVRQSTTTKNTSLRALATTAAGVQGTLGVVSSGVVGPGGTVVIESVGRLRVLLETGITPTNGQIVFVSAVTAGRGTTVQPAIAEAIGTIVDATLYSTDRSVVVSVNVAPQTTGTSPFVIPDAIVYVAADPTLGNDATGVFSASATVATASPFKTLTALLAKMPRFGNMCTLVGLLKAGTYLKLDGVTVDDIDLTGFIDYKSITFRASDFTNSTADKITAGGKVVTGTSATGYTLTTNTITPSAVDYSLTPIRVTSVGHGLVTGDVVSGRGFTNGARFANGAVNGYWTVTRIDNDIFSLDNSRSPPGSDTWSGSGTFIRWSLAVVGGGVVSLAAEPGLIGKRFRFASNAPTVALQNASFQLIANDATHIIFQTNPGTIAALDYGFFEEPSVFIRNLRTAPSSPGFSVTTGVTGYQFAGISAQTVNLRGINDRLTFCEQTSTAAGSLAASNQLGGGQVTVTTSYVDEAGTTRSPGVGMRASCGGPFLFGLINLAAFSHVGTGSINISNGYIGSITNGYFGSGLALNNCGGRTGGSSAADGAFSVQATNAAFARGPRIKGVNNIANALLNTSSSVFISGADLSDATGTVSAITLAGIQHGGYGGNTVIASVSGHNNGVSLSYFWNDTASRQLSTRNRVSMDVVSGNIGLYSFNSFLALFNDSGRYIYESFYDLLLSSTASIQTASRGIEDTQENILQEPFFTGFLAGAITRYTAGAGRNIGVPDLERFMLVSAVAGSASGYVPLIAAIADSVAHAAQCLGAVNAKSTTTADSHFACTGQRHYVLVDLTGGHVAATQGQPLYLSQTRAGYAQADIPGAGVIKQVAVATAASEAVTGVTPVVMQIGA